jgi:glycine cleavage system H protein
MEMFNSDSIRTGPLSWLWVKRMGAGRAVFGLTETAVEECGLIVHVELPEEGDHILHGHPCLLVETLAGEIELPAPLSGRVSLVNGLVERNPGLLHQQPGERGWLLEVEEPDAE